MHWCRRLLFGSPVDPTGGPGPSGFPVCPAAVVVDEASDVAFPGGIAPAVKARASPADQSGRGKGHRLPFHVCDTYRVRTGLRYGRGRIYAVATAVHPNRQRITGFNGVIRIEADRK